MRRKKKKQNLGNSGVMMFTQGNTREALSSVQIHTFNRCLLRTLCVSGLLYTPDALATQHEKLLPDMWSWKLSTQ